MMRRRKERRPDPPMRWVRPEGGFYRGTGPRVGLPPTTPATAEGFRRQEREAAEAQSAEAERAARTGPTGH